MSHSYVLFLSMPGEFFKITFRIVQNACLTLEFMNVAYLTFKMVYLHIVATHFMKYMHSFHIFPCFEAEMQNFS